MQNISHARATRMVNILRMEGCKPSELSEVIHTRMLSREDWEKLVTDSIAAAPIGQSEYDRFTCLDAAWRLEHKGLARMTTTETFCYKADTLEVNMFEGCL